MSDAAMILADGSFNGENIRKVWHKGEWYFSIIDVVAELLKVEHKRAKTYWATLKQRLKQQDNQIPCNSIMLKLKSSDNKAYLTDVANLNTCKEIIEAIRRTTYYSQNRVNRGLDEVINLHPLAKAYLESKGGMVEHHVILPSGKEIDLVAYLDKKILVVEVKSNLKGGHIFQAIGQVLCYAAEYGRNAKPIVACLAGQADEYAYTMCHTLGIELLEIVHPKNISFDGNTANNDLVTENALLGDGGV